MNDHELLAAIAQGDDMAFRELFQRHAAWLAGRLRRSLPADVVEDVLQETFLAVWRSTDRYQGEGEVGAWLWGIARRQAALWHRKQGRGEPVIDVSPAQDPEMLALTRVELERAFAELQGHNVRELAQLALVEQHPLQEIAARFNIPVGTVKSRLYKIRQLLQAVLRKEE
ncbi:MAG: RNA polymerase sigma factor [Chloroflexota bacterium]|nr:RNA polymerase sigma factor [Chloroflexota bacterium]